MHKKTNLQTLKWFQRKWLNKYVITFLLFLTWLIFFDKYNFFAQANLKRSITKSEMEYENIKENILITQKEKEELESNQEKYGREKYYLHKNNEDVFIIDRKDKN